MGNQYLHICTYVIVVQTKKGHHYFLQRIVFLQYRHVHSIFTFKKCISGIVARHWICKIILALILKDNLLWKAILCQSSCKQVFWETRISLLICQYNYLLGQEYICTGMTFCPCRPDQLLVQCPANYSKKHLAHLYLFHNLWDAASSQISY